MKVEKRYYNIKCDCCGQLLDPDSYWDDGLEEMAEECSWKALEPDKHYCPDCYEWDDEDHLVTKDGKKWDEAGYEITDDVPGPQRYTEKIKVGDNVTDIMKLPCVQSAHKRSGKEREVAYYTLAPSAMADSERWQYAHPGEWLVKDENGKWYVTKE
jgi:hypothetical protein